MAEKSRHPDREMVARHDRLMAQAAASGAEAQRNYDNPKARQAAIEKQVQAKLYAEAIYDTAYNLETAKHCWEGVRLTQEFQQASWRRRDVDATPPEQPQAAPSTYTLQTQPPAPPSPSPISSSGNSYIPARPNTWGNSPYGVMVPPVMRDQPLGSGGPMVPPVAR